ncbi:MAG: hypothetical protein JST11_01990 [Acidobacteria bacterium]|nr:hypothetical protein [Acidobacteriota bacterium]
MAGSSVDPYAHPGATRLFLVILAGDTFRLTLAADANSTAPAAGGKSYPNTDQGILAMYQDLAASPIFSAVKYCYVPGRIGPDLNPNTFTGIAAASVATGEIPAGGYDPGTGLRIAVLGSAVSQVVPLDDFLKTRNEQIYNDDPVIVPIVTALVYDVTQYNTVGATTFVLPVYYTRDQVSAGNYYVSKFDVSTSVNGQTVHCGQTAVFPGGPGFNDSTASALKLETTAVVAGAGHNFTVYTFDTAKVATISTLSPKVETGVIMLTYNSPSPSSVFANQRIIGFYRDNSWTTCLGQPIYDFGASNASFTAATAAFSAPVLLYDPTHPFLNGGSLQNVVRKLAQAPYLYPTDRLVAILDAAIAARDTDSGAGLSVTSAALKFNMSSTPAAPVVDQLSVPVMVTATTTPVPTDSIKSKAAPAPPASLKPVPDLPSAAILPGAVVDHPQQTISVSGPGGANLQIIGGGIVWPPPPGPVTVQAGLTASIPREVLAGTGITSVEIGTAFPRQNLGSGAVFQSQPAGRVVNLMESRVPALPPYVLNLANAGFAVKEGVSYILSVTGTSLTVRGSDGSSASAAVAAPGSTHTYVGAMVYTAAVTAVPLYPKLPLSLAAPAVGTHGVLQGEQYSVRLTFGTDQSRYDILDSNQTAVDSNIAVPNPVPGDKFTPQPGDLYFGSFIGGSNQMTVWSVPVFLTVSPTLLPGAGVDGNMTLDAQASGLPGYQLQITDSSLFIFSNVNVDTGATGSLSPANVFLAAAVINSAPDDTTSKAFAPCRVVMGLVRQVQMGTTLKYVFVPEDDSVVIGQTRYMLSVINLDNMSGDPNTLPYPPVYWPQSQYWQFANRHNPYLDVEYAGADQTARISRAQTDTARIGLETAQAQEPMQMYLDTGADGMTVWPIYAFPYATSTQTIDLGQLKAITNTILNILKTPLPAPGQTQGGPEQIVVPGVLQQPNPYTAASAASVPANPVVNTNIGAKTFEAAVSGLAVTNLNPDFVANTSVSGLQARQSFDLLQSQQATADLAITKSLAPAVEVTQAGPAVAGSISNAFARRQFQPIYGFSVYNPGTGEAYLVEVVETDIAPPNQLPNPTQNVTYDPYYVRVVFLNTLTCYNMSIIVPSMVYDQYRHFAQLGTAYKNILSKTDELKLGYMYSLYDAVNNFDDLNFSPYSPEAMVAESVSSDSPNCVYTNIPYSTQQNISFNPLSLFGQFSFSAFAARKQAAHLDNARFDAALLNPTLFDTSLITFIPFPVRPAYFVCRRQNWSADCHLMQATQPAGKSIYLAFGGGDIVPFRLDADFTVDKRSPSHLYKLTYTFADQKYDSAKTISVANTPYFVGVTTDGGVVRYKNFSINATAGTADLQITSPRPLTFPTECYVVGQASTTLISMAGINTLAGTNLNDTGDFVTLDSQNGVAHQEFQLIPYNNLVYMVRAISNFPALGAVGGLGVVSGLLVDTFVPSTTGNLKPAQGARYKRSGLPFFGSSYTPTTMVDTLDTLDFTSVIGETFRVPTIFIPIPELDAAKGFVADLSNFLGQQIWTLVYPEIVAQPGEKVNGVTYPNGLNLDGDGKPVLSVQKLHFVYDPIAVMFTPNDLAHKYPLLPKQQVLALTNGQIQEGICWRSANVLPQHLPPTNICAQQILPAGDGMDRPNIIYSSHNRAVMTPTNPRYMGMSVHNIRSLSGVVYNIEESAMVNDQTGAGFVSAVSSVSNMLLGVLFDYDNNDLGTLGSYDETESTKGIVFLNGYLSATGYAFSSPDHFDVNDVLPSQLPLLEQVALAMGWEVALYNTDVSLPRQFWSLSYDSFTAAGLPNYIPNVPPSPVDPTFTNRTRSLILSLQNPVRPEQLGLMDTFSSVVSANLHLQNGVTGSIFINKKADRDVAQIGSNPVGPNSIYGLPAKYDFFIFSRDHYSTLTGATFELVDMGYAMCLMDDGTGTGTKVARYYIDTDGNYNELYTYALYSPTGGIIESSTFTVKVMLGTPANPGAVPVTPATPNSVNPQDLVAQINKVSSLIYAAFGPASSGQPPAFIPIQAIGTGVQAGPILGPPGVNGYALNVVTGANRQPVQISQIYSGISTYPIAGTSTVVPINPKTGKAVPFYGSISHGLDKLVGSYGGNGLGSLIGLSFSVAFQGSAGDSGVFYTYNAIANSVMDSTGKSATPAGGQYFVDATDSSNTIYAVVTLPKFTLNGNTYAVNLGTTLPDGVTSRYSLVVGGKSYLFGPDNAHVTVDRTVFTFNSGATVSYGDIDLPTGSEAPTPIPLTPFSVAGGGVVKTVDVFNNAAGLKTISLSVAGRLYNYDPVHGTVVITQGANTATVQLQTGLTFASNSGYGYVIGFNAGYTVNGKPTLLYNATTAGSPATYSLMTNPQMFTIDGNFYVFDQDSSGNYVSVTGDGQTCPVNPYQFSLNGAIYIINTSVQPNTVVGGGNVYTMTAGNTQFVINGVQYTVALKSGSLNGATISGQFNITQGNVVVIENYVYQLDTLNGQIVGNGTTYPLTTSGFTYTITTADRSFTVTTKPNATTVTIGNVVYLINNTTVVGDGVTYPILVYRTFADGASKFSVGLDGVAYVPQPFTLSGSAPYTKATFTDGATFTVNDIAAFDGTNYFLISGAPAQFKTPALTYTLRTDGVSIAVGSGKTYIVNTTGPLTPNQFTFGTETIFFGRPGDLAAFDGVHYYAISNGQFTDSNTGHTYTLSGNTAVSQGNSYEIFSNLGQNPYFEVPGGPTYYVNVPVADTGSASGDIFRVFPVTSGQFTIPLAYTVTVTGSSATVNAATIVGGPAAAPTLTASGGKLTGGHFQDPVTKIVYTCVVDGSSISFIDSNNAVYGVSTAGATNNFVANVFVTTAIPLAVDSQPTPSVYPIANNQFIAGPATYTINVPVAYQNAATGPYWQMVNGRFIVPKADPVSDIAYTVKGGSVTKGYVISGDDEFSVDGNVVYTVNAVNVVRATNQDTLAGNVLTAGPLKYTLNSGTSQASFQPAGLNYDAAGKQFTVSYNGLSVTYTVAGATVTDNRNPVNVFTAKLSGSQVTFTDTLSTVTFSFDGSGNNPITASFVYTNDFFIDVINEVTYYISGTKVEAISYLPESTQYAFVPADGKTYLIHYNDVSVVFPVISGQNVNAGIATVGSDTFTVHVDEVDPTSGGPAIPINLNSFEINGNLYTITGTPTGSDYSSCFVAGDLMAPKKFASAKTFQLTDPAVTYTLQLDANNLPTAVTATFKVKTSEDLILVNDDVYVVTYNTVSTGSLLGQGRSSIAIANSSFTLSNPFDSTKAKFIFADLNIFDAASVVGQFNVYLAPTFFLGITTYTLDPVNLVVMDNNKRPFPLLPNPTMFSINGFNYVIDTNRVPHAIIGNNNVSPLATDVTVEGGQPVPNSTFTLNGQVFKYTEDTAHNILAITGTKSYVISQPGHTVKLDSSLVFTLSTTPPAAGTYPGTVVPIGTVTAGTTVLNVYAGTPESGYSDFFMYKNVLYTLVKSGSTYVAVQKSYTVYAAKPVTNQQQLAVFDLGGTAYMVTDGTTAGAASPAGINPGTMWAQTANTTQELQFGLVYGFTAQPINVTQSTAGVFQFLITDSTGRNTLYDIVYTRGGNANMVKVDIPNSMPTFTQNLQFGFVKSSPLTFETGGYNAFTAAVDETAQPYESFAGAYRTPVVSTSNAVDSLISAQGDFSLEFWHSLPLSDIRDYHPVTYNSSTQTPPLVYFVDVDFMSRSEIFVQINNTVMRAKTTPPVLTSGWRHFALTYEQPYVMLCDGAPFEVKQGTNYNFNREFSIAITFSASDVVSKQGLLYKGTGSSIPSPDLSMSYSVAIRDQMVTLTVTDGSLTTTEFQGPAVLKPDNFYQVIIVKQTATASANSGSAEPYAPPFDPNEIGKANDSGSTVNTSGFPSGSGSVTMSGVKPHDASSVPTLSNLLNNLHTVPSQGYTVTISVREVHDDGTFGEWQPAAPQVQTQMVPSSAGLIVNSTGSAHLLIGSTHDNLLGLPMPLGGGSGHGNIREVFLFNGAINREGINTSSGVVNVSNASPEDLIKAGLAGCWRAAYDPNGIVNNPFDSNAAAISTNAALAKIAPLAGHEFEATSLYINGTSLRLRLVTDPHQIPDSMSGHQKGSSLLNFNAGLYKLEEISMWQMIRQPYQVIEDMFGRLISSNEPFLIVYLSGEFDLKDATPPILPLNSYIDNIKVVNAGPIDLRLSTASIDLAGCPAVGRCGPLITPNLYTPPGVALTVCDTVPYLTTYSITVNTLTSTPAGVINEAYVYINDQVLTLYAGKKVGDLVLSWVSQEQGDPQLIGYIEGAPPCPMANMTNKPGTTFLEPNTIYPGATSITFTAPTSVKLKYQQGGDHSHSTTWGYKDNLLGFDFKLAVNLSPFGFGIHSDALKVDVKTGLPELSTTSTDKDGWSKDSTEKFDEAKKYTVKLQGTLSPITGDPFMGSLNTLTAPSATPGNPSSKTAILPNPNLGGFTASNPPTALPKAPTDEKFGSRMFVPSPYGQAFVSSQTLDVYQQTLLQTNTVYGFVRIPDPRIPRDINILSFRMSSKYIRPGCLDGVVHYVYNPATLPTGAQTYATSTGQMEPLYDGNFSPGQVGHDASYMKVVEAYRLKKQIDQQAFNAIALYQTAYDTQESPTDSSLTPGLDFYNEYVWSSRGGTQEVKHTYATSYDEVYTTSSSNSLTTKMKFNVKVHSFGFPIADFTLKWTDKTKDTIKYSFNTTASTSFDVAASFDGVETDTQMRYACNNDAHFVMNNNSMFNPNNQSGLNLVIGSDGLVYNIVPSVTSGAGLPLSDNIDTSQTYAQPQPSYTSGNADGLTGALEPYDRPGKTKLFRTYTFFLQPSDQNNDDFWNTIVDPVWLANSPDTDAAALRPVKGSPSMPWRLLYRVTYSERFLPPVSSAAAVVPQITPVMAVPVVEGAADFLFQKIGQLPRPAYNPANDLEANIVLVQPTSTGVSAGSIPTKGPNNVIPFDLIKGVASIVNWGDSVNAKLLSQLLTSALGLNIAPMSPTVLPGSTKVADIMDPAGGGPLYSIYTDPNGLTVNVPIKPGITLYQDVNSNPIQYYDGKAYHSLQADYIASPDGTVMYYIQPPSTYDQSAFDLVGDYDLFGHPGDEWRYYLVSGMSSDMTSEATVGGNGPFLTSTGATPFRGFTIADAQHGNGGSVKVKGYVLVQGLLQWPSLNTNAETFSDVQVYKALSLLDTFPIGDPEVLIQFLKKQYPHAPFFNNDEINLVFARNIVSYFNTLQQALIPQ